MQSRIAKVLFPVDRVARLVAITSMALLTLAFNAVPTFALSELKNAPVAAPPQAEEPDQVEPEPTLVPDDEEGPVSSGGLPDPDPLINRNGPEEDEPETSEQNSTVEYLFDIEAAPEPVRRMRALIVEAAASGEIERLRPLLNPGPNQTQVPLIGDKEDLIETLKSYSGDADGVEILAILLDILQAGFVRVDAGTPEEVYVWPYFAEKEIGSLSPPEKVQLLRIVTAGDLESMQEYGNYNFFRVGITPDGEWKFFTAGD